jgi:hypothetical protein
VAAGAPARDAGQLGAILGVRSEAALAVGEVMADAGGAQLQAGDRLEVAGEQRQASAVARRERLEHVGHAGRDELAEILGAQAGVGGDTGDAELLAPRVEAFGGDAQLQADRPRDLVVGPAGSLDPDRAQVADAVDLAQRLVHRLGVGGGGLEQQSAVDVEQQQHAAARCQNT